MENFVTNIDINEAIWRNHYQIVVADKEDCNCSEPLFFGSAFRMCYRGKDWLITADHVIHPEKHGLIEIPEGQDIDSIEHNYFLINNYNAKDQMATMMTSLAGFYFFDKFNEEMCDFTPEELNELGATDSDFFTRIDVAFSDISRGVPGPLLTHDLTDHYGNVIVANGLMKLSLTEGSITTPSTAKEYFDYGVIKNEIVGFQFRRVNAPYGYLKYIEEKDNLYRFQSPIEIKYDEWAALSGSAMFDDEGKVVGMTIRVDPESGSVWVLPMPIILKLIDYAIAHGR